MWNSEYVLNTSDDESISEHILSYKLLLFFLFIVFKWLLTPWIYHRNQNKAWMRTRGKKELKSAENEASRSLRAADTSASLNSSEQESWELIKKGIFINWCWNWIPERSGHLPSRRQLWKGEKAEHESSNQRGSQVLQIRDRIKENSPLELYFPSTSSCLGFTPLIWL